MKYKVKYFYNFDTSLPSNANYYASSKRDFRKSCEEYSSFEVTKFINLQIESFFGPNKKGLDFASTLIIACLNKIDSIALSECNQVRDFIYYQDLISDLSQILKKPQRFGID